MDGRAVEFAPTCLHKLHSSDILWKHDCIERWRIYYLPLSIWVIAVNPRAVRKMGCGNFQVGWKERKWIYTFASSLFGYLRGQRREKMWSSQTKLLLASPAPSHRVVGCWTTMRRVENEWLVVVGRLLCRLDGHETTQAWQAQQPR